MIDNLNQEIDLIDIEIGNRPVLKFFEYFKKGEIRRDKADDRFAPFKFQSDFLKSKATQSWIIGGNASGKTQICCIKTVLTLLGFNTLIPAPNNGIVVSLDWPKARDVSIPCIFDLLPKVDLLPDTKGWNKTEKTLRLQNGSKLIFMSADSGRSKFQGLRVDFIQIDEEVDVEIYKELKMRAKAGKKLYIWGCALPFNGYETYLYKDIFLQSKRNSDYIEVFEASIYDNLSLHPEFIKEKEREYVGVERQIRLMGKFANIIGEGIFSWMKLADIRKMYCREPETGRLEELNKKQINFIADKYGSWQIWEHPIRDEIYSIGVDVATEGGKDFTCIQILKYSNRSQVAIFHGKVDEVTTAKEIILSAIYYCNAPVIIEITGYGRAVQILVMKEYYNLYRRMNYDKWGNVISEQIGFETTGGRNEGGTKPILIADGKRFINDLGIIRDKDTIIEFQNYIRHPNRTLGARPGMNDDRVMAFLLALRQINETRVEIDAIQFNKIIPQGIKTKEEATAWMYI